MFSDVIKHLLAKGASKNFCHAYQISAAECTAGNDFFLIKNITQNMNRKRFMTHPKHMIF